MKCGGDGVITRQAYLSRMANCECGCGGTTDGREFLQGHDQRLRTNLEQRVGGLLKLRSLVEAAGEYANGTLALDAFADRVRASLARRPQGH